MQTLPHVVKLLGFLMMSGFAGCQKGAPSAHLLRRLMSNTGAGGHHRLVQYRTLPESSSKQGLCTKPHQGLFGF